MIKPKIFGALAIALMLAGCATEPKPVYYTITEYRVVTIPPSLYNCPYVHVKYRTGMTDRDISGLLISYASALQKCHVSEDAIKKYIDQAKKQIEAASQH